METNLTLRGPFLAVSFENCACYFPSHFVTRTHNVRHTATTTSAPRAFAASNVIDLRPTIQSSVNIAVASNVEFMPNLIESVQNGWQGATGNCLWWPGVNRSGNIFAVNASMWFDLESGQYELSQTRRVLDVWNRGPLLSLRAGEPAELSTDGQL